MEIASFAHEGLQRLYVEDSARGLPAESVGKLRLMLAFLQDMGNPEESRTPPRWKAHKLTGDRAGTWAVHVTANRRLTFRVEGDALHARDLEGYH